MSIFDSYILLSVRRIAVLYTPAATTSAYSPTSLVIAHGVLLSTGARETFEELLSANALSVGVDQMQRNFDGMRKQVEAWRESQLSDTTAKLIIYRAFVESDLEVPRHLAKPVHDLYFSPKYEEFQPRGRGGA